ncbi:MAG: alpha/beta fold hydrolase [Proteobacteria bacterium]|nr:alpha/beta fold hydrolase [Pseudomonadota bacterium]
MKIDRIVAEEAAGAPDAAFLFAWARQPERWRELLDAAEAGALDPPEPSDPDADNEIGVAFIGRDGAVAAANESGWRTCERRLGLVTSRGQRFFTPANHEAVVQARRTLGASEESQVIVKLTAEEAAAAVFAFVCPAAALGSGLKADLPAPAPGQVALVFPAAAASSLLSAALRQSFGLTPAEIRLTEQMRGGASIADVAEALGVSINTARNQLRGVFDKMGLKRQSDLVRALSQLAALSGAFPLDGPSGPSPYVASGDAVNTAPPIQHFDLPDGRRLAWRDYGARDGRPVLIVHQGLGGSLYPRGTDALARDLGLRLIVPARPGVSSSDPRPDYSYDGVAEDMAALLDELGVEEFQIGCVLDGAPYALAMAAAQGDRVTRLMLCNPRPPGWRTSVNRDLAHPLLQFRRRLAANPYLAEILYPMMRRRLTPRGIERFIRAGAAAPADAAYLEAHPDFITYSIEYVTDGFIPSARGMIDSTRCAARAAPMDLDRIRPSITLWLGAEDPMLTEEEARAWLGPKLGAVRLFPKAGNFLAYQAWPEMLAWLADG